MLGLYCTRHGGIMSLRSYPFYFTWGVAPVMTHQASWLGSTGTCGVQQHQAGVSSVRKRAECASVGSLGKCHKLSINRSQTVECAAVIDTPHMC